MKDKDALASLYLRGLGLSAPLPDAEVLARLESKGLTRNKKTTAKGRRRLKVVLAGGVFDIIHPGHVHTLNEAARLGDVLVVVIATDQTAIKMKKRKPLHDQEQRRILVDSLNMTDGAIIGNDRDIFKTVSRIQPDIIALGYDQIHQEKAIIDGCAKVNVRAAVARLQSPIPKISSSSIQKQYGADIHGT